ncbi:hypothetical protein ACLBOM_38540 [Escherichia coli]
MMVCAWGRYLTALSKQLIPKCTSGKAKPGTAGSLDSWYSSWVMARGDANQLLALLAPGDH